MHSVRQPRQRFSTGLVTEELLGRPWVVEELRNKSWEDLHSLWWVCCRERNILATQEYERRRLKAGYGAAENMERFRVVSFGTHRANAREMWSTHNS